MADYPAQTALLNSNAHVKSLIDAAEARILRIESQIFDLTLELQKERSTLARLWLMATPMGKLPTELLVEIFAYSVEGAHSEPIQIDEADAPNSSIPQALRLSHVCPYWRRIVNSTPKLWTARVVDVRLDRKSCKTEAFLNGLETLLERSAPLPISVSLTQTGDIITSAGAMSQAATTSAVIRAMAPTIRRWKSLKVDCLSFKPLTALPGGSFPALESLDMQYDTYGQTDPVRAFCPAPRLQRLALHLHGPVTSQDQLLLMPWSQLTHLKLEHHSLARCREILMQCSSLLSADLLTTEWNFQHAVSAPATVLPFLETLKVRFDMGDDETGHVEPFFEPLSLPSLRTLALVFDSTPGVLWPMDDFSAFQLRSPHIADIALTNCPITPAELITLLRRAPEVTTLTVLDSADCIDEDVLRLLTYDENDSAAPLAPQLRQIHWEAIGYIFSERMLETTIRSRWWTDAQEAAGATRSRVARLQKATILRYERSVNGGLIHRMQDLVEQGLDLNLAW
ncbi:hypothetical protein B0H17DRAFT_500141 [Mycena rosella]|uniref:F-box domain-containing protein n=1 Tax=Mycena rosella TaxID=1033263 RepID=A0AAD7DL22_MYCRO|nr:hypothetical protein B0H17DRAFT_500141 [Mycena rosella]